MGSRGGGHFAVVQTVVVAAHVVDVHPQERPFGDGGVQSSVDSYVVVRDVVSTVMVMNKNNELVSYLVRALSQVNHKGLYQG